MISTFGFDHYNTSMRLLLARFLVGCVLVFNIQCALVFLLWPEWYAPGFQLAGIPGAAAVRAMGVLFLMWNVPYLFATCQPRRNRLSLIEAFMMQAIGLVGESWIYTTLLAGQTAAQASTARFIAFDAAGLAALLAATWLSR